jgi:colicin import membrane protein
MALGLHLGLVVILLLAGWWQPAPQVVSVAGPVVEASLVVSPADVAAAERAMQEAPKPAVEEAAPPPQPLPAPRPEISPEQVQPAPQEQLPEPDTVDQEAVARLALEQQQAREREEQEARRRQEQIDLTEREKQAETERRQRLREQLEAVRKEREAAERRTKMEEQRLQQLADRQAAPAPRPEPARDAVQAGGNNGVDTDLAAKYALAMHQTAQLNWNRALAPERVPCKVRFTQIPGGEVIDVSFLSCGFDAQARESVERALRRSPMPYTGFEPVFARQIDLTFCYPEEACPR